MENKKITLTPEKFEEYSSLIRQLRNPQGKYRYSEEKLADICSCSRNTISKIADGNNQGSSTKEIPIINYLLKAEREGVLTKEYINQLTGFKDIQKQYEEYALNHIGENFSSVNKAFLYMLDYITDAGNKGENMKNVVDSIRDHMYNFHMEYNPYYSLMRGSFNKELRPIIDFNIDYDKNRVLDLTVAHLSSSQNNLKASKYDLEYAAKIEGILNQQKVAGVISQNSSMQNLSFDEFIVLIYDFTASYESGYNIRFLMYDESLAGKMDYIESNLKRKDAKDKKEKLKYYNLARMFSKDEQYMPIEKVLCNYNFDILWWKEEQSEKIREEYINKVYTDVPFRVSELDKLVTMVAMLDRQRGEMACSRDNSEQVSKSKEDRGNDGGKSLSDDKIGKYKALFDKMEKLGLSEVKIAKYCKCARNTIRNIKGYTGGDGVRPSSVSVVEKLLDKQNIMDKKFFVQLDKFKGIEDKYFELMEKDYSLDLNPLNYAFSYVMKYITKGAKKGENLQEVIRKISLHMYNFHMKVNPYYYLMRGYFNKELRPIIDFNMDYDNNTISDLTIHTLSTAHSNIKAGEYDLDYERKMSEIVKNGMNGEVLTFVQHTENTSTAGANQDQDSSIHSIKISFAQLARLVADREKSAKDSVKKERNFEEFVDLLYKFTGGYFVQDEDGEKIEYHIRFLMYDSEGKIEYIKKYFDKKYGQDISDKLKFYNLARLFRIDDEYLPLEQVLCRYHLDQKYAFEANEQKCNVVYSKQLAESPEFRLQELDKLIVMVCGLGYEPRDLEECVLGVDQEGGCTNQLQLDRIEEIKARQIKL